MRASFRHPNLWYDRNDKGYVYVDAQKDLSSYSVPVKIRDLIDTVIASDRT